MEIILLVVVFLGFKPTETGATSVATGACADDPTFDCAHIATAFDICADVTHARAVCRKFCNLCTARDCNDAMHDHVGSISGDVYLIKVGPTHTNVIVQCDMASEGGGWTVIMNRVSPSVDFNRNSTEYADGFGDIGNNFWMGLNTMHAMTSDGRRYQLLVKMTSANDTSYSEIYDDFRIGPAPSFVLHLGHSRGSAGNSMGSHSGYGFTTYDVDRDTNKGDNCARYVKGGWWFHVCYDACLTCPYVVPGTFNCQSMSWNTIGYCTELKSATMLVRPM